MIADVLFFVFVTGVEAVTLWMSIDEIAAHQPWWRFGVLILAFLTVNRVSAKL